MLVVNAPTRGSAAPCRWQQHELPGDARRHRSLALQCRRHAILPSRIHRPPAIFAVATTIMRRARLMPTPAVTRGIVCLSVALFRYLFRRSFRRARVVYYPPEIRLRPFCARETGSTRRAIFTRDACFSAFINISPTPLCAIDMIRCASDMRQFAARRRCVAMRESGACSAFICSIDARHYFASARAVRRRARGHAQRGCARGAAICAKREMSAAKRGDCLLVDWYGNASSTEQPLSLTEMDRRYARRDAAWHRDSASGAYTSCARFVCRCQQRYHVITAAAHRVTSFRSCRHLPAIRLRSSYECAMLSTLPAAIQQTAAMRGSPRR